MPTRTAKASDGAKNPRKAKKPDLPLLNGKDNMGWCYDSSCGSCAIRKRCKRLVCVDVDMSVDDSDTTFHVVVESYRLKSVKWALWKWLNSRNAESYDGKHVYCYSMAEQYNLHSFKELCASTRLGSASPLMPPYCIAGRIDATLTGKENAA